MAGQGFKSFDKFLETPQTREIRETAVRTLMVSRPQMTKKSRKQEITILPACIWRWPWDRQLPPEA